MLAVVVTLSLLMVSTFRYRSFKGVDLKRRRRSISVLGIALLFLVVALEPKVFLLAVTSVYSVSGPLAYLVGMVRRRGTGSASVREAEETRATP
jgi:CDP-diacylglycerol--serine O-phosphatidyltransferase